MCTAVMAAACRGEPLPELVWFGEHVEVAASVDLEASTCAGSLPYLDWYAGALRERLGAPSDSPIAYYWLPEDLTAYEGSCPNPKWNGCVSEGRVFTKIMPHEHELVHAVRAPLEFGHPLLEEGLAVHLGDDAPLRLGGRFSGADVVADLDDHDWLPLGHYETASAFYQYLVQEFGGDEMLEMIEHSHWEDSAATLDSKFKERFGVEVSALARDFDEDDGWCAQFNSRDATLACEYAEPASCSAHVSAFTTLVIKASLDCDDVAVIGHRYGERARSYSFEIDAQGQGPYQIIVDPLPAGAEGEEGARLGDQGRVILEECGVGCGRLISTLGGGEVESAVLNLREGTYRLRVSLDENADPELEGIEIRIVGAGAESIGSALCDANP